MRKSLLLILLLTTSLSARQTSSGPNWTAVDEETLRHFQAMVKMDTTDPPGTPPGGEKPVADYVKQVLEKEGIPVQMFALEANRPNVVARLKGNGKKRPLLIMGHTDTVNVDAKKWTHPPFSAERNGGYIYGRGTVDDKDNLTGTLMTMLLLKRQNVPLDRDVIFLAEAGEEGATRIGIQFMVNQHWDAIDAEYCLAEGGTSPASAAGEVRLGPDGREDSRAPFASPPRARRAMARCRSRTTRSRTWATRSARLRPGHRRRGSTRRPRPTSSGWPRFPRPRRRRATAMRSAPTRTCPGRRAYSAQNEPRHCVHAPHLALADDHPGRVSVERDSVGGHRQHRRAPGARRGSGEVPRAREAGRERSAASTVEYANADSATGRTPTARLDSDAFKALESMITKHYKAITLPTMSTGATDMAYLRAKGMQCYGIGPALDVEDGPKGFGAHSDQERILESELYRFVRFAYDAVVEVARAR